MPVRRRQAPTPSAPVAALRPIPLRCELADLLNIPFVRGGRTLDGIDCLGLWLAFQRAVLSRDVYDPWTDQLAKMHEEGWREFEEVVPDGWEKIPLQIHLLEIGDTVMTLRHRRAKAAEHIAPVVARGMVLTIADRPPGRHEVGYSQLRRLQDLDAEGILVSAWRLT